jgi:hypothetical protein
MLWQLDDLQEQKSNQVKFMENQGKPENNAK